MREAPILFQDRLVQAILAGRKTETRRVGPASARFLRLEAGDRLWVREAWAEVCHAGDDPCQGHESPEERAQYHRIEYRADTGNPKPGEWPAEVDGGGRWRPSIHMPRAACRLVLELTAKPRIEPLQAMREADAIAEGIERAHLAAEEGEAPCGDGFCGGWLHPSGVHTDLAIHVFRDLWDSINASRGYGWAQNPNVVVLSFQKVP